AGGQHGASREARHAEGASGEAPAGERGERGDTRGGSHRRPTSFLHDERLHDERVAPVASPPAAPPRRPPTARGGAWRWVAGRRAVPDFRARVVGTPAAPREVLPYEPWLPPEQAAANSTPIIKTHRDRPSERRRTVDIGVNARRRVCGFRSRTAGAGRRLVTG